MTISRRQFVVGTSALALSAPATIARAQSDNIKFASILDLSGGLDIYGAPMAETTKLAIEDINAAGWSAGAREGLELKMYDAQSDHPVLLPNMRPKRLQVIALIRFTPVSPPPRARRSGPRWHVFKTLYFYNTQYEGGVCDYNNFCTGSTPAQTVAKVVPHAMNKWGKKVYIVCGGLQLWSDHGAVDAKIRG